MIRFRATRETGWLFLLVRRVEEVEDGFVEGVGVFGGFVVGAAGEDRQGTMGDMGGDLFCVFRKDDIFFTGHDQGRTLDGLEFRKGMAGFGEQEGEEPAAVDSAIGGVFMEEL